MKIRSWKVSSKLGGSGVIASFPAFVGLSHTSSLFDRAVSSFDTPPPPLWPPLWQLSPQTPLRPDNHWLKRPWDNFFALLLKLLCWICRLLLYRINYKSVRYMLYIFDFSGAHKPEKHLEYWVVRHQSENLPGTLSRGPQKKYVICDFFHKRLQRHWRGF